jgi:hypothetical protein
MDLTACGEGPLAIYSEHDKQSGKWTNRVRYIPFIYIGQKYFGPNIGSILNKRNSVYPVVLFS